MSNAFQEASQNLSQAFEEMEAEGRKIFDKVRGQADRATSTVVEGLTETLSTGRQVPESLLDYSLGRYRAGVELVESLVSPNPKEGHPQRAALDTAQKFLDQDRVLLETLVRNATKLQERYISLSKDVITSATGPMDAALAGSSTIEKYAKSLLNWGHALSQEIAGGKTGQNTK